MNNRFIVKSNSELDWMLFETYYNMLRNYGLHAPTLNSYFYYEMDMWLQRTEKIINCPSLARFYEFASEEDKAEFILKWM